MYRHQILTFSSTTSYQIKPYQDYAEDIDSASHHEKADQKCGKCSTWRQRLSSQAMRAQ